MERGGPMLGPNRPRCPDPRPGRSRCGANRKPSAARTHHLHLIEPGHPQFTTRLAFRDALRAEPETAAAYAALKVELAARHRGDREAYTEAKAALIEAVVERVRPSA